MFVFPKRIALCGTLRGMVYGCWCGFPPWARPPVLRSRCLGWRQLFGLAMLATAACGVRTNFRVLLHLWSGHTATRVIKHIYRGSQLTLLHDGTAAIQSFEKHFGHVDLQSSFVRHIGTLTCNLLRGTLCTLSYQQRLRCTLCTLTCQTTFFLDQVVQHAVR